MTSFNDWRTQGSFFSYLQYQIFYRHQPHTDASKPTLLLLHGFPTASWDWHKVWDSFTQHFHLVTLDYLGYGCSDKPAKFNYHTFKQADICTLLMEYLGIKDCLVLAHDYGDTVLQELLARQNNQQLSFNIKTAALLNGGIFVEVNRPILIQRLMVSPLGFIIGQLTNRTMFGKSLQRVVSPQHQLSNNEIRELWTMHCHNGGRTLLPKLQRYQLERKQYRVRWRGALTGSICPLMFISGDLDTISGAHMRAYYEQHMPNAKTAAINCGHYPQLECPDEVVQHVLAFYQSLGYE